MLWKSFKLPCLDTVIKIQVKNVWQKWEKFKKDCWLLANKNESSLTPKNCLKIDDLKSDVIETGHNCEFDSTILLIVTTPLQSTNFYLLIKKNNPYIDQIHFFLIFLFINYQSLIKLFTQNMIKRES